MGLIKNIVANFIKSDEDKNRLRKVVIPTFTIHFFAAILGLTLAFVMTRGLGTKQYGIFSYSFSIVAIVVNLATYCFCLLTVREVPSFLSKGQRSLAKGLYRWSVKRVIFYSFTLPLAAAAFIAFTAFYLHIYKNTDYIIPLLLALISVPVFGIMNYHAAALRSRYKIILSLLPDNIIKPTIYLVCLGILYIFSFDFNINNAVLVNVIAYGSAALFSLLAFYKTSTLRGIHPEYEREFWLSTIKSFFLLLALTSINSRMDILMLGWLKTPAHVGVYSIADMVASKLIVFQQIMNFIIAPSISRMNTMEQKQKLQDMITKVSRAVMILSVPVFLGMVIFSKYIMLYFGLGFESGQYALIIIAIAQLVNIACGPVGNFALMTGNQRYVILFTAMAIFINFLLNVLLTPSFGINGTAIAMASSLIAWNAGMFFTIWKKAGIRTWVLG